MLFPKGHVPSLKALRLSPKSLLFTSLSRKALFFFFRLNPYSPRKSRAPLISAATPSKSPLRPRSQNLLSKRLSRKALFSLHSAEPGDLAQTPHTPTSAATLLFCPFRLNPKSSANPAHLPRPSSFYICLVAGRCYSC